MIGPLLVAAWRRLALMLVLASCALLPACKEDAPAPVVEPQCAADKPCKDGQVCQEGLCVNCKRDRECAIDEMCHPIRRRCELKPCYGRECETHDECALGLFCVQGKCLSPAVTTAEGCRVVSCAEGEACNEGERCHPINLVCEEDLGCASDADCGAGLGCNVAAGRCEAACTPENAVELCGMKRSCHEGRCVDCVTNTDCGSGLQCNALTNVCESLTGCLSNRDCEVPLVCNRVTKQCTVDPGPCLSAEECASDETCQLSTGLCVPARCLADRFEPNDILGDAAAYTPGALPNLTLCAGDVDLFRVALAAGDRLYVVVDVDPLLNFDVAVLDAVGSELASGAMTADAVAAVSGDHYVRTRTSDPYVRYGLRATLTRGVPCSADAEEPNQDFQHASALLAGDLYGRSICPGDADYYAIAVTVGQQVEVKLASTALDGALKLDLFDASGTQPLASSATAADVQTVSASVSSGGRVYLRVTGELPSVQNKYDLGVTVRTP